MYKSEHHCFLLPPSRSVCFALIPASVIRSGPLFFVINQIKLNAVAIVPNTSPTIIPMINSIMSILSPQKFTSHRLDYQPIYLGRVACECTRDVEVATSRHSVDVDNSPRPRYIPFVREKNI